LAIFTGSEVVLVITAPNISVIVFRAIKHLKALKLICAAATAAECPMPGTRIGIAALLCIYTALLVLGYTGFSRLLPALLRERGVEASAIGAAYSVEKAAVFAVLILALAYSLKAGPRAFAVMHLVTALVAATLPMFAVVSDLTVLVILVPLSSGLYMSLRTFNNALINMSAPGELLGRLTGLLQAATRASAIASTALSGLLIQFAGLGRAVWVLAALIVSALPLQIALARIATTSGRRPAEPGRGYSLAESARRLRSVILNPVILYDSAAYFFQAGVPIYISVILWDLLGGPLPASLSLAAIDVVGLVSAPVMGVLVDRVGRPVLFIALSNALIALDYLVLSSAYRVAEYSLRLLLVAPSIAVFSVSPSLYSPSFQKFVKHMTVDGADALAVFSSVDLLRSLLSIPAPLIAGMVIAAAGYSSYLSAMSALILGATAVFLAWFAAQTVRERS